MATDDSESGRRLRAKQRKRYNDQDIDEDDIDGRRMYSVEDKLLSDQFDADMVQKLKGPEFTLEWMQKNGLTKPIVFYDKTGLGLRVPSENFKVSDVKQCVGSRRMLDVMDVNTQKALEMSMKEWVKYYENPARDRLLNVISLEFCHTRLENYVESPTLVRQIDWVDRAWPRHLKECQTESTNLIDRMKYPKVQKYCLMSVAGCYTDFHIDFGGTSVWYHILHGEKIFWLAPPSQKNIDHYVEWTLSAKQDDMFLGDTLECCQRIKLQAGYTFIIPSGWIHAVYTPVDSLVFGGNFLHSFNIDQQLLVARVEEKTYVPSKFKYPFYQEIMWYVVDRYLSCLTGRTYLANPEDVGCGEDLYDDQGLIQVDEDSRPPSRNPDSRPPSRAMDELKPEKEEETPKLSKSVTIELTRIDANLKRSPSEDENQPPAGTPQGRPRGPRKVISDPNAMGDGAVGPRKWVNFTTTELKGVIQLIDYLSGLLALPPSKRGVPKDLLDPEAVLKELRQVLEEHKNDDQELAVSGEPVLGWPELSKKKQKMKLGYKTYKSSKAARAGQTPLATATAPSSGGGSNVQRRRRTRCKKCEACTRTECGECTFCKDMRKFGGPGRMKQTCISRQCMAPILPSAAVCALCTQGDQPNPDDPEDISMSLMECGICWEIVHPKCLKKKLENSENEGVINEDLPNSWECLRCCYEGKQGQLKSRHRFGGGGSSSFKRQKTEDLSHLSADSEGSQEEEGTGRGSRSLSPLSPPVEGKRVTAKEGSAAKCEFGTPIKWGNNANTPKRFSPMFDSAVKNKEGRTASASPAGYQDDSCHKKYASGMPGSRDAKRMMKTEKSPVNNEESSHNARKRQTPDKMSSYHNQQQQLQEPIVKRPKRESPCEEACAVDGGGQQHQEGGPAFKYGSPGYTPQLQYDPVGKPAATDIGLAKRPFVGAQHHYYHPYPVGAGSRPGSYSSTPSYSHGFHSMSHSSFGGGGGGGCGVLSMSGSVSSSASTFASSALSYVPTSGQSQASSSPMVHVPAGSKYPVPFSVPLSSSLPSSSATGVVAGGYLQFCHDGSTFYPSRVKKEEENPGNSGGNGGGGGGDDGNGSPGGPSADKLRWGTDYAPKVPVKNYVVRPAPPLNIPEFVEQTDGQPHPLPRALWAAVFRWLPQADLARLSAVCRTFDCWVLDPRLWPCLDLSRRSVRPVHLRFVVLRQPKALKLASAVVSYAQLAWLIARLPGLKHLDVSNLAWASVGALCSADCPLLHSLDLSWATGLRDLCFRELASPPANLKPGQRNVSRLSPLERLSLTGTDINDQSLKTISLHLPRLTALDLTCCMRVTDRGIRALVSVSSCRLRELRLVKCVQLTERCLEALAACPDLTFLALTDNPAISQEACVRFSRSYKHRTLRAHAHGIISV